MDDEIDNQVKNIDSEAENALQKLKESLKKAKIMTFQEFLHISFSPVKYRP